MTTSLRDIRERGFGATLRRDAWWIAPALTAIVLGSFGLYATWAAWVGKNFEWGPYLSPFYSPLIETSWWPLSPAFLILIFPLGFRMTCYYYRKAYYRSFWWSPAACAVPDAQKRGYSGETRFPLLLQNYHRYMWYVAVVFIVLLTWDALLAFRFPTPGGGTQFGIGVGTLVMWLNVILLAGYTFSCHSCRHVCGGYVDVFSKTPTKYGLWRWITRLNERHPAFAWLSLFSVGLTDLYIRLVAMGVIRDLRIL